MLDVQVIDLPFTVIAGPLLRAFVQLTDVSLEAVSFMDAPLSSSPWPFISCLLMETSYVFFASSNAVITVPEISTSVLLVVFVTAPSFTVNIVVVIML